MQPPSNSTTAPFNLMAKPAGAICNLNCAYCFYLEKEKLYSETNNLRMPDTILQAYIKQYITQQEGSDISFVWQGGEPMLMGLDFFKRAVKLQKKFSDGRPIHNALQTNGTLLNRAWAGFLRDERFLVGISIDGPEELHDAYRLDKRDRGSFKSVMQGWELLQQHQVEVNTLTVVNRINASEPKAVYEFLKGLGSRFIQFIPLIERQPSREELQIGLDHAAPPAPGDTDSSQLLTESSVRPDDYSDFLIECFKQWVTADVGYTYIQFIDVALSNWLGAGSPLCYFAETCGRAPALEHNGDVFSCDHYVYPEYHLGNILDTPLPELVDSPFQQTFGTNKKDTLPRYCRECEFLFACNGECPKHRFMTTPDGEPGLNVLCPAYKQIFAFMKPYMDIMASLLREERAPAEITGMVDGSGHLKQEWQQGQSL